MEEALDLLERIRRRMLREMQRILAEMETLHADVAPDGSIRPLYTIYEYPDRYVILVDLPAADASTINVSATEDKLVIEAQMERELSLSDIYGTMVGREVKVTRYRHVIPLPEDADPSGMKVNVRPNKVLEIVIPRRA